MFIRRVNHISLYFVLGIACMVGQRSAEARSLYAQTNYRGGSYDVYWVSANQHVNQFRYDTSWHWTDLTATYGAPLAQAGTALSGSSHNESPNTTEVYWIGTNQHIYEFWEDTTWHWTDLTAVSGAPSAESGSDLSAALTSLNNGLSAQLFFLCANEHVCRIYYDNTHTWHWIDLSAAANAPIAIAHSALANLDYVANTPTEVYYLSSPSFHIYRIWQDASGWHKSDMTVESGNAPPQSGSALNAGLNYVVGTMEVYYTSSDKKVRQLWRNPGAGGLWNSGQALTDVTGSSLALLTSGITSYPVPLAGTWEVYWVTNLQQVNQYWYDGNWHAGLLGGPVHLAAATTGMTAQFNFNSNRSEVYYVGTDGHVYYFYYDGAWHTSDITGPTGAPTAVP